MDDTKHEREKMADVTERLVRLEVEAENGQRDRTEIKESLQAINVNISELAGSINELKVTIARNACPNPGLCVPTAAQVSDQETRLRAIEENANKAKGGMAVIMAASGIIGGGVVWALGKIFKP